MKAFTVAAICLWLAAGLQQSVAPRMTLAGVSPDFLLVTLVCISLFGDRRTGAVKGFFAGVLHGAAAGANLGAYAVSRTVTGFLVGWFPMLEFEASIAVAFVIASGATLFAQILFMFGAPPARIVPFLLATIGGAVYNGVLAMPLFALLKRILDPPSRP